jgi:type I restriction enzyme S subunit
MVGVVPDNLGEAYINQHVALCRPARGVNSRALAYALTDPNGLQKLVRELQYGATKAGLSLIQVRGFPVPIPPEAEQEILTQALDQALAQVDSLAERVASLVKQSDTIDACVLAKAFRGGLVDQDPNDEPASVLLERIRAARETAKPAKRKRQVKQRAVATASRTATPGPTTVEKLPPSRQPRPPLRLADYEPDALSELVFAALWGHGALDKDTAVRTVAAALRDQGFCDYKRLRKDGALYAEVLTAIELAIKAGHLDRPRRNHVRAVRPSAANYTTDDWRLALLAALGPDPTDRDEAIRAAAEWAGDNLGLEFKRLRSDGLIVKGLKSAINSGIRRGEVERCTGSTIRRASNGSTGD